MNKLLIKNGTCITPNGRIHADVLIDVNGKISRIEQNISDAAEKIIDATNQFVLPGLVDTQVHFREPGNEHKENLEAGTRGAALGGVTGVFEMPNTSPTTTTPQALQDKLDRMKGRAWTNYAFYVGGTPQRNVDWHSLEILPGCCGIKIFMGASTGDLLVAEDEAVEQILAKARRRVAIHSEDNFILTERKHIAENEAHPRAHHIWRNKESAISSTNRLLKIARKTSAKVHVLHITTAEELEILSNNKDIATVEILPQHLYFNADQYENLGTRIQMNPPIRDEENRQKLWTLLDVVDVFGSDHAPHTLEEKSQTYPKSPSGMPGVQTIVPVLLNFVNEGKLTLEDIVSRMSTCLGKIWGVKNKGALTVGFDGDITIVDLEKSHNFTDAEMANVSGWTPYANLTMKGVPTHTIIDGNVIMENGKLNPAHQGKPKAFEFEV